MLIPTDAWPAVLNVFSPVSKPQCRARTICFVSEGACDARFSALAICGILGCHFVMGGLMYEIQESGRVEEMEEPR